MWFYMVYYISRIERYILVQRRDLTIEIGDSSKTNLLF
jgi:hypothetical protein